MSKPKRPVKKSKDSSNTRSQSELPLSSLESSGMDMDMDEEDVKALQEDLARAIHTEDTRTVEQAEIEDASVPSVKTSEIPAETSEPVRRRPLKEIPSAQREQNPKLELIGKIARWGLVPLIFLGVFFTILKKHPTSEARTFRPKPSLPIKGALVQVTELSSGWRPRTEDDRVSAEMQTITRASVFPSHLPYVQFKISPELRDGYLRVLFFNSEGKIAGDARVVKITQGRVEATSAGQHVISDQECMVVGSTGLQSSHHLADYLAGEQVRWSVEISESNNYQARGDEWKLLDSFALSDVKL